MHHRADPVSMRQDLRAALGVYIIPQTVPAESAWFCADAATCSPTARLVKNRFYVAFGKLTGLSMLMEFDVRANSVDVRLFGTVTVMSNAKRVDQRVV